VFDVLTFLHLFVYPMLLGVNFVAFVWAASRDRIMLSMILFWAVLGSGFLAIEAHVNYLELLP